MALLNYPTIWHVTKYRAIKIEMGVLHQLDQSQIFSCGHNFIDITFKHCKINKNRHHLIIHRFGRVTTYWLFFQKAPLFIFIWLLKWSCLGHNMMNQAKYPEYQVGQVDIAVEQCVQAQGPVCKAARDWRPNSSSWAAAPWCQEPAGWPVWVGRLSFRIKSVNVDIVVRFPDAEDVNGLTKTAPPPPFVPKFCHLDKKVSSSRHSLCEKKTIYIWYIIMKVIQVLRFFGHFSEEIPAGVGSEGSRVRNVQVSFCHLYPNNTRAWIGSTSPQGVHLVCQTVSSNSRQSPILPCPVVIQSSL